MAVAGHVEAAAIIAVCGVWLSPFVLDSQGAAEQRRFIRGRRARFDVFFLAVELF